MQDDILRLSLNFREAKSQLKEEIEQLKHDKNCRDVVFMLKDFEDVQTIGMKIEKGSTGVQSFTLNEKLTLKYMLHRRGVEKWD